MKQDEAMRASVEGRLIEEPQMAAATFAYLGALLSGSIDRNYSRVISQTNPMLRGLDHIEAYWFARVHAAICENKVAFVSLPVGAKPMGYGDDAGNRSVLSGIKGPVRFLFLPSRIGRRELTEAVVSWSEPLVMRRHDGGEATISPGNATLLIGLARAAAVFHNLSGRRGAVARWPHDSDKVWLLVRVDRSNIVVRDAAEAAYMGEGNVAREQRRLRQRRPDEASTHIPVASTN